MDKHRQKIYWLILVLFALQVGLIFQISGQAESVQSRIRFGQFVEPIYTAHSAYVMSAEYYDQAYATTDRKFRASDQVYAGIVPHHLFVKDRIANFFSGLDQQDIQTVVLIGPNHFERGGANIIISRAKWLTPYGDLMPDLKLIDNLVAQEKYLVDEEPFGGEHAINGLVPFIKKSLPQAKIVPIIVKNRTSREEASILAAAIRTMSPKRTLVLATVDFSHYQTALVADFHDEQSQAAIQSFDLERISKLEIDSPASILTILYYAQMTKAFKADLLWQTNTSRLINQLDNPGTSHQFYYFTQGDKVAPNNYSFLFFGDMMLDRNVGKKIAKQGLGSILDSLAGEEKRFFMGPDLISANLEGAVTNQGEHYAPVGVNDFAFSSSIVSQLKNYNFNYFTIANNHLTDQGERGQVETASNLAENDFYFSGCADAFVGVCTSTIVNMGDKKIGMVGLSMVYRDFDLEKARKIISELRTTTDLVIVNIHWGNEYEHQFNIKQKNIGHALIDAGSDIIIGHHPHVVQGMEIYNNKPIFYSLGNFVFDQYFSTDTQEGLALGLIWTPATQKFSWYFLPLQGQISSVKLMTEAQRVDFMKNYFKWSTLDSSWSENVLSGRINL